MAKVRFQSEVRECDVVTCDELLFSPSIDMAGGESVAMIRKYYFEVWDEEFECIVGFELPYVVTEVANHGPYSLMLTRYRYGLKDSFSLYVTSMDEARREINANAELYYLRTLDSLRERNLD